MKHISLATAIWLTAASLLSAARPDETNAPETGKIGAWKMETLRRKDGKVFRGLLQSRSKEEIQFIEVVRPRGKPMGLVIHYYPPRSVEKIERIPPPQRAELRKRIGPLLALRSRARIEAGRMEDIRLDETTEDATRYLRFRSKRFTLLSTADEETTRRCAVRIAQVFQAYRQALPPRQAGRGDLRIVLYGSMDQYHTQLRRRGWNLENPAYYSPSRNTIVAGSDLSRYAKRLAEIRTANQAVRRRYDQLNAGLSDQLASVAQEMKQKGFSGKEIREELRIRKAAWNRQYEAAIEKIKEGNRRNEAKFAELTQQMFSRLYHEAFHAYLENYVYPHRRGEIPRWLNEGLAQVFENGQLDEDTLRIDAPNRQSLLQLQENLRSRQPLRLAELLAARPERFLLTHAEGSSQQHYLYAWGIAYYLTFQHNVLGSEELDRYVDADGDSLSPIERFEKLVGMPLPKFERQWRKAMLELKPAPR